MQPAAAADSSDDSDDSGAMLPQQILEQFKRGGVEYYKVSWGYNDFSEERCADVAGAPRYVPLLTAFHKDADAAACDGVNDRMAEDTEKSGS